MLVPELNFSRLLRRSKALLPSNSFSDNDFQPFFVIGFSDQTLYTLLIQCSPTKLSVLNHITLQIPVMTVGKEGVLSPTALSEQIKDIVEVFSHENSNRLIKDIPIILILEGSQFMISSFSFEDSYSVLCGERSLTHAEERCISDTSPYIATDSIFRLFSLCNLEGRQPDAPLQTNVLFSRKTYIESWINTIRMLSLPLAYIGPPSTPQLMYLNNLNHLYTLHVDVQRLSSRISVLSPNNNLTGYPFPYGYSQFLDLSGNTFNLDLLSLRIRKALVQESLPEDIASAPIYFNGLPFTFERKILPKNCHSPTTNFILDKQGYRFENLSRDPLHSDPIALDIANTAFLISTIL